MCVCVFVCMIDCVYASTLIRVVVCMIALVYVCRRVRLFVRG